MGCVLVGTGSLRWSLAVGTVPCWMDVLSDLPPSFLCACGAAEASRVWYGWLRLDVVERLEGHGSVCVRLVVDGFCLLLKGIVTVYTKGINVGSL